jgi:hypothetical protein
MWISHRFLTVQLRCYWKQLWSRWAITGSWEPLVSETTKQIPSWSEGSTTGHNFGRRPSNDYFIKVWFQLSNWFQTIRFLWEFPIGSYVKLSSKFKKNLLLWNYWANLNQTLRKLSLGGPLPKLCPAFQTSDQDGHHSRTYLGPSNDDFIKVWFQLSNWFQTRRFLCEFPIGSYVKLRSAVQPSWSEGHPMTILSKLDSNWATGSRQEDFYVNFP